APRSTSTTHGESRPGTAMSMRPTGRCGPEERRWYPRSAMICCTRLRVAAETSARPLRTFDTVGTDTPAEAAISAIVTRRLDMTFLPWLDAGRVRTYRRRRHPQVSETFDPEETCPSAQRPHGSPSSSPG